MSVLVVELLDCGIIFGADRYFTHHESGRSFQRPGEKIFKWPREDILFGFAGVAEIGGLPIQAWLEDRRSEYASISGLSAIAMHLRDEVEKQRRIDEGDRDPEGLIIHLGGFEETLVGPLPQVWHVQNVQELGGTHGYKRFQKEFRAFDAFANETAAIPKEHIRAFLRAKANGFDPFWFHQGIDYFAFNALDLATKAALNYLSKGHPGYSHPRTLDEWKKRVAFSILMYGAYFQAYRDEGEQYVGGGVDVLSLPWPDSRQKEGSMPSVTDFFVLESTHESDLIPQSRVIASIETTTRGGTIFEIHSVVIAETMALIDQYRYPGVERLKELFRDMVPDELQFDIPLEQGLIFARAKAMEIMLERCDNDSERIRLSSVIKAKDWLKPCVTSPAFSLSVIPADTLKLIYDKTRFQSLRNIASEAGDIQKVIEEYRGKRLSIEYGLDRL